jgi:HSP20 family protein
LFYPFFLNLFFFVVSGTKFATFLMSGQNLMKNKINSCGGFDMINELALLNNVMNNIFDDGTDSGCSTCRTPDVDVKETKDGYTLEMDLPGRTEKDISIELDHNTLTIASTEEERREEKEPEDKKTDTEQNEKWLIRERSVQTFSRSFTLPDDVNTEQVAASFKNGVLSVVLPRTEAVQPKRIAIEAAA